jgi:outer membrane protein OmpA-like peptidoglycan-associated protein
MNSKIPNAAVAILLGGAAIVAPAAAQDSTKPTPGAALQYVGADTRLGVGVDSDNHVRGELFQVLHSSDNSATLAEIWARRDAGGGKLSHHWTGNPAAVNKLFIAVDQGENDRRKATVGGGQEYERWFWNASLSKGLSGSRLLSTARVSNTITQSGIDAGRPFEQDLTTTVTSRAFDRAYDWGVGGRAGHFYESALLRVTAGVDYEWGKYSSKQWTGSLVAEKFFSGSPISVALSGELNRRSGDFEGTKNDRRGFVMLRYELGAPKTSFRPSKVTRTVTSTERVPDPNWKPVVAAGQSEAASTGTTRSGPPEATTRLEKRVTRASASDAQETYFDLGSARLKPAALRELDALVSRIAAQQPYVELKVNVVGHTCPTGSDRNNFALSGKRAAAVKTYLVSKGVPENLISTDAKAGKAPKYPEVKGQSFRNRRADTDVIVVKEKVEEVRVPVAAAVATTPPAGATVPANPALPQVSPPMIERQVQREVIEDVPNNWISRALHNPAQHKTSVDSYRWVETSSEQTTGPRRYINRGPAAVNDSYTVDCNAPTVFNVLVNDSDPDGDPLTITSVTTPGRGTAVISGSTITYTANGGTCGGATDSFSYSISDGRGGSSSATVAVAVRTSNRPPVALDDRFDVPCATPMPLNVLVNDSDPDGDPITITAVTQPAYSRISITAGGKSLLYTPGPACFTVDTFTYTISDGKGGTATAKVTLIDP